MKHTCFIVAAAFLLSGSYAQPSKPEYTGKLIPSISISTLQTAAFLDDLAPGFWDRLILPGREQARLSRMALDEYQGYQVYLLGYNYVKPKTHPYNRIIDYVSVEITASNQGDRISAQSPNDLLTSEQKQLLARADLNTDIDIRVRFRYKQQASAQTENNILEGKLSLSVVPETEASYPGGFTGLRKFLSKEAATHLPEPGVADKLSRAIVDFVVDEAGKVAEVSLPHSSSDPRIDALLIRLFRSMNNWKPAQNKHGIRVKQHYRISLGYGC